MILSRSLKALCLSGAMLATIAVPQALAHDEDSSAGKNMRMISVIKLKPTMEKDWANAWATMREIAEDNDYPHTEFVMSHRNTRWIITPIANFSEVDEVFKNRQALGKSARFEKAYGTFTKSMMNSSAFFTRHDPELSYNPEGHVMQAYFEIDSYQFKPEAEDKMRSVIADYKTFNEKHESPYGYDVYWNSVGSPGASVTVVSTAKNALEMAKNDAAGDEMMAKNEKEAGAIFARFLEIAMGSQTEYATFKPDMSMNLPQE